MPPESRPSHGPDPSPGPEHEPGPPPASPPAPAAPVGRDGATTLPPGAPDSGPGAHPTPEAEAEAIPRPDPIDLLGWPIGYWDSWEPSTIELPERSKAESREARMRRLFGTGQDG
jgi:hypothetical protein